MSHLTKTTPRLTQELAELIWRRRREGLFQHQIAAELGINQGRVSEVLNGHRFSSSRPAEGAAS